jgi:hypothetical protein
VFVGTSAEADELWSDEELDWVARRANVLVAVLDEDPSARERAVDTLEALPESDAEVELAPG